MAIIISQTYYSDYMMGRGAGAGYIRTDDLLRRCDANNLFSKCCADARGKLKIRRKRVVAANSGLFRHFQ
jgi:hypothetical protein